MGWIISTCILGILVALLLFVVYVYDRTVGMNLSEINRLKEENKELKEDIDKGNKYLEDRKIIIRERNRMIGERDRIIDRLKAKLERKNKIIDRLTNMNAPQPVMEPQIIQNIA